MRKLIFVFIIMINISFAFTYVQVGDTGRLSSGEKNVAALVQCINPDFVINTGDVSYVGGSTSCRGGESYPTTVGNSDMYGPFYPNKFFPTVGNHDYCTSNGQLYFDYFSSLYGNEKYYEQQVGDVHIFSLDYKHPTEEQKAWFKQKAGASTASHKIVIFHTPPYHVGKRSRDKNMEFEKWGFEEVGISAIYVGHEHTYQRFLISNIPYFVNGAGGNYDGDISHSSSGGHNVLVTHQGSHGALVVSSSSGIITWEFVGTDGEIKDAFPQASGRDYSNCRQDNDKGTSNIVGSAVYTPQPYVSTSTSTSTGSTVASSAYPTCTHCSMIDQAWSEAGSSKVYVPGHGLLPHNTVYPPVTVSTSSSFSSSSSSSSSSSGSSGTCVAHLGDTEDDWLKAAFLDMTAWAEVGGGDYETIFGGGKRPCEEGHPQEVIRTGGYNSSAYGRYQFLTGTARDYGGPTWDTRFCKEEQDKAGWRLVEEKRKVTVDMVRDAYNNRDLTPVLDKTAKEWASFPYSGAECSSKHCTSACFKKTKPENKCSSGYSYYGQGGKTAQAMLEVFDQCYKIHSGQTKRVLVIGDSQVGGYGGSEIEELLESNGHYVDRVGCVGATTTHLLNGGKRCSQGSDEMQSRNKDYTLKSFDEYHDNHDLVILMAGGNEYKTGAVNVELYNKLQNTQDCAIVGLINLSRDNQVKVNEYYASQETNLGKCAFIDVRGQLKEGTHNKKTGDPHLNTAGGKVVADLISSALYDFVYPTSTS